MTDSEGTLAERVRAIWTDTLGETDPDARFLSAGGHSVLAAKLIARIGTELGATLSLATFLGEDRSVGDLVDLVERARSSPAADPGAGPAAAVGGTGTDPHGDPASGTGSAPISPAMRRIWTWHRIHPDSPAYNVVRVLEVDGRVQPAPLRSALADLADRHEALRCHVDEPSPAQPEVVVAAPAPVPLTIEVVRGESDADVDAQVGAALRRVAEQPIPMDAAPLWRCGLVWSPSTGRSWIAVVMHHLISDLRASDIVLDDLATAYAARRTGSAPDLPGSAGLLDHLRHQATIPGSPRWHTDLDWWRGRLEGRSRTMVSPTAASDDEHRAGTVSVDLPPHVGHAVDAMLRTAGITPAVLFLTLATAVLSARSGGEAGVIGVPSARAARPADERTVTFLLDTLLLTTGDPGADERTVLQACAATRLALLDAVDHASPTYDEILGRLQLPRSGRSPLIRLWFNDLTGAAPPARFGEHPSVEHDLAPGWALFDLGVYVVRPPTGYRLHVVAPQASAPDDVAAFAEQLLQVCSAAAADPHRRLADLVPARTGAPEDGSPRTTPGPGEVASTVEALAGAAAEHPAAAALVTADGVVDRRTLDDAVTDRADRLRAAVAPGVLVALPARRDRLYLERLLACMRAGAVPVLIDAAWPRARRDAAIRSSGATYAFPDDDGPLRTLTEGATKPAVATEPAHVLFTSGTTADPLPVLVPTAVTDAAVADLAAWLEVGAHDRIALLSGPAHDPALRDLGLALRTGASLHVPAPTEQADVTRLAHWLRTERVSVLSSTPTLLTLVLGADPGAQPLPDLRVVVCGGAPLTSATAALIRSRAPGAVIVNGYGCVETPQLVVAHRLEPDDLVPTSPHVPLGRPLPGRRIELLTADGQPCADGERGEIWVGAPWIASRYLTDGPARFVAEPDRLVRTGDLAHRDRAGLLHLVGRADRQVLVNSYRVLLDEVEAAARGCNGVADAVAELVGNEHHQGLRLWVQPSASGESVDEATVRAHLADVLAPPAVPTKILLVDRLGLSANLKPLVPTAATKPQTAAAASAAPVDARLTDTAASVLGRPVGPTANFFDAGFTSITLLRLGAELTAVLDRPVEPLWLFQHPNLRALASALELVAAPEGEADTTGRAGPAPRTQRDPARRRESPGRMRDTRRLARQRVRESREDTDG
ncbi:non-ribosomal peptide synthetase component F [Mumia flava]|uniref:Non-ribosomal peptide synthetase component F n=1 Tax=Mumia flava TaxID=1348852 RepID=A0A0B2B2D2_9ACTN|nr:AMP-binding protein [Mumia flava]PJJ54096.1 non-ribosomal peptide synthetase component F [Mumia flava]